MRLLSLLCLTCILTSCHSFDKIKTATVNGVTTTFSYESPNGNGRLMSILASDSSYRLRFTYSWPDPTVALISNGQTPIIFKLDPNDHAYSDSRGNGIKGTPYTYQYDAGYLIKSIYPNDTVKREYKEHNLSHEWSATLGDWSYTYTDEINTYENQQVYLGEKNYKWPLQRKNNITGAITNYTYHKDAKGRVDQQTASGEQSYKVTFTYY